MSKEISEYDIIEVVALNPNVPEASVGDLGAVLVIHRNSGVAEAIEAECVLPNGANKWQGSFSLNQVKLVSNT